MAMIVRGEERTCSFCFANKKVKVDAYVCIQLRFNGSWWDLCEEHFGEFPNHSIDDDDVVLLVSDAVE
jgi:hypothetical protein